MTFSLMISGRHHTFVRTIIQEILLTNVYIPPHILFYNYVLQSVKFYFVLHSRTGIFNQQPADELCAGCMLFCNILSFTVSVIK
jgi:hypothetical protein